MKRLQIRVVKYSSIHSSMTRMIYGLGTSGVLNKLNKILKKTYKCQYFNIKSNFRSIIKYD